MRVRAGVAAWTVVLSAIASSAAADPGSSGAGRAPAPSAEPVGSGAPRITKAAPAPKPSNLLCPVMTGTPVDLAFTSVWDGKVVAFSSVEAKRRWDHAPAEFAPNLAPDALDLFDVEPAVPAPTVAKATPAPETPKAAPVVASGPRATIVPAGRTTSTVRPVAPPTHVARNAATPPAPSARATSVPAAPRVQAPVARAQPAAIAPPLGNPFPTSTSGKRVVERPVYTVAGTPEDECVGGG